MTNPLDFWITQLNHFALQVSQCTSHIEFLSTCISMGIPPKGLCLKIPSSAMPPCMHESLGLFGHITSVQLTQLTLDMYLDLRERQLTDHLIPLIIVSHLIPDLRSRADAILRRVSLALSRKREHNLRKLSSLFVSYLRNGIQLPISIDMPPPPPNFSVPPPPVFLCADLT